MICSCPNRATLLVWATAMPTGMGSAASAWGAATTTVAIMVRKDSTHRGTRFISLLRRQCHTRSPVNGAARGPPASALERSMNVTHEPARALCTTVEPAVSTASRPRDGLPEGRPAATRLLQLDSRRHGRAKYVRMSAWVMSPSFRVVTRRGFSGAQPVSSRARCARPAGDAAAPALRIAQWAHFVPAYDDWFDRKFAVNGEAIRPHRRDRPSSLNELRARADTEVATQQGHDLFAFPDRRSRTSRT